MKTTTSSHTGSARTGAAGRRMPLFLTGVSTLCGLLLMTCACFTTHARTGLHAAIKGNGTVVEEQRQVIPFHNLALKGSGFNVVLSQGTEPHLSLSGEDNLLPYIVSEFDAETLYIGLPKNLQIKPSKPLTVFITVRELRHLDLSGALSIRSDTPLQLDTLGVNISGVHTLSLNLLLDTLNLTASGMNRIALKGRTQTQTIQASGTFFCNSEMLQTAITEIEMAGGGEVTLNAYQRLSAKLFGTGIVRYIPHPNLKIAYSGTGNLSPLESEKPGSSTQ